MMAKFKNAIIFIVIAVVIIGGYMYFFSGNEPQDNLVSSNPTESLPAGVTPSATNTNPDKDFLPLLLSVQNIKLDDGIFSDPAFASLVDSSITLTPEGNEGRPNPFAPLGAENTVQTQSTSPNSSTTPRNN